MPNILDGALSTPVPPSTPNPVEPLLRPDSPNPNSATTDPQQSETLPASNAVSASGPLLGFCYSCNRQNHIDLLNFTCSSCNGGFVELIAETPAVSVNRSSNQPSNNRRAPHPYIRSHVFDYSNNPNRQNTGSEDQPTWSNPLYRLIDHISTPHNSNQAPNQNQMFSTFFNLEAPNQAQAASTTTTQPATENTALTREQELESELSLSRLRYRLRRNQDRNVYQSTLPTLYQTSQSNEDSARTRERDRNRERDRYRGSFYDVVDTRNEMNWIPHGERLQSGERESSRSSSSSSSRRRSRSPPTYGNRTSSTRPFPRLISLFSEDDDMFFDHGAIIITTLINQLRNRGAAPASEIQIQNLPTICIDQKLVDDTTQCAVCMDDFSIDENAKKLPCKHLFHDPCIGQWLKLHATCPVCRSNINGDETTNTQQDQTQNIDAAPTFLNIIPLSSNDETGPGANTLSSLTVSANTNRLNNYNLRNNNMYRIHIRQNLAANNTASPASPTNPVPVPVPAPAADLTDNLNESLRNRLRSSIRVTTRFTNDRATPSQDTNTEPSQETSPPQRLYFNQMMQRFMSRYRQETQTEVANQLASHTNQNREGARTWRNERAEVVSPAEFVVSNENSVSNEGAVFTPRNESDQSESLSEVDDDVIEIVPPETRDTDDEPTRRRENLPHAKRRKI